MNEKILLLLVFLGKTSFVYAVTNPHIYPKIPNIKVKNWKAMQDQGIVKQNFDFSCGASSVATLPNNLYGTSFTEQEILEKMGLFNFSEAVQSF